MYIRPPGLLEVALSMYHPLSPLSCNTHSSPHCDTRIKREYSRRTVDSQVQGQTRIKTRRKQKDLGIMMIPS